MVLSLIVFQIIRSIRLVAKTDLVDKRNTAFPVACEHISRARAMDVILASGEVPHEISPVHPVHLIVKEEGEVLEESRLLVLGACHLMASTIHIRLIELDMFAVRAPHSWEKHLSRSIIDNIARPISLDVLVTQRGPIFCGLYIIWSIEILTIYERVASVLLTAEVTHQGERIVRLILVGRGLCA